MNKIKCSACGVVNWISVSHCIRCKTELTADVGYVDATPTVPVKKRSYGWPIFYSLWVIALLGLGYVMFVKEPAKKADAAVPADAPAAKTETAITVPEPPAELNIKAPKLEYFSTLLREEIVNQNGVTTTRNSGEPQSTFEDNKGWKSKENIKAGEELTKALGPLCTGGGGGQVECNERLQNYKATRAANEHNKQMAALMYCPPKPEGEITLAEPGKYRKIGEDVFYIVKVQSAGLEGVAEGSTCVTKPSIIPLFAKVVLRWSNTTGAEGWQASSKSVYDNLSMAKDKENREAKKEEREKIRYEKWQQQGREQANKRMHDRIFKALE